MRRLNGLITALLILLSVAGVVGSVLFLRHEDGLEAQRQSLVSELDVQLRPLNEKRKELQEKDKEWQKTLEEEKDGKPCIMLCFNTMDQELYETIYDRMEQYNFRGMFVLKDGRMPGDGEDVVSSDEFAEMMDNGWEYMLAVEEEEQEVEETEDERPWLTEETEETEEETGGEAQEESSAQLDNRSFVEKVDGCLTVFDEHSVERPDTLLCTREQYESTSDGKLSKKGFQRVCVMNREEYPVIGDQGEELQVIDSGVFTQKDKDLQSAIEAAIQNEKSMAITINDVRKILEDSSYDLSTTRFEAFLIYLKNLETEGKVNILTFSEYSQYMAWNDKNYEELVAQYAEFREEMNRQIDELDAQEQKVVDTFRSENTQR